MAAAAHETTYNEHTEQLKLARADQIMVNMQVDRFRRRVCKIPDLMAVLNDQLQAAHVSIPAGKPACRSQRVAPYCEWHARNIF